MFKKINVQVKDLYQKIIMGRQYFNSISFSEYEINNKDYIFNLISEDINFKIKPDKINLTTISYPGATPHTDNYSVALNYYLQAESSLTDFWKSDLGEIDYRIPAKAATNLKISHIGNFEAVTGDVYLLNTHILHSVTINSGNSNRIIFRCLWKKHTFEEILDSIKNEKVYNI